MKEININTEEQKKLALEYSEKPEVLNELLNDLKIEVEFLGRQKHFESDTEEREVIKVNIERNGRKIDFNFGLSLKDSFNGAFTIGSQKELFSPLNDLLYSILCSCRAEFYCSKDFEDWAWEFGYDIDSRQAYKTWKSCLKQSAKLEKIFNESEMECLPC